MHILLISNLCCAERINKRDFFLYIHQITVEMAPRLIQLWLSVSLNNKWCFKRPSEYSLEPMTTIYNVHLESKC